MRQVVEHGMRVMSRGLIMALAAACLLSLGPTGPRPASAAPAVNPAASAPTAEGLVRALYQNYLETAPDTVVGFDFTDPAVAASYFDPALSKLVVADAKSEQPRLNFDPFIEGQEFEIKAVAISAKGVTKTGATVIAQFDNFDEKKTVTFKMVRTSGGWRIADVQWDRNPQTLRALLSTNAR